MTVVFAPKNNSEQISLQTTRTIPHLHIVLKIQEDFPCDFLFLYWIAKNHQNDLIEIPLREFSNSKYFQSALYRLSRLELMYPPLYEKAKHISSAEGKNNQWRNCILTNFGYKVFNDLEDVGFWDKIRSISLPSAEKFNVYYRNNLAIKNNMSLGSKKQINNSSSLGKKEYVIKLRCELCKGIFAVKVISKNIYEQNEIEVLNAHCSKKGVRIKHYIDFTTKKFSTAVLYDKSYAGRIVNAEKTLTVEMNNKKIKFFERIWK